MSLHFRMQSGNSLYNSYQPVVLLYHSGDFNLLPGSADKMNMPVKSQSKLPDCRPTDSGNTVAI